MKFIENGVCAPKGFKAAGAHAGIKSRNIEKNDLMLLVSETVADAAAVFTKNVVKAAPVMIDMQKIVSGKAKAIIANSGIANACTDDGMEKAEGMCALAAKLIGCDPSLVYVSSTGVIGQSLPLGPVEETLPLIADALSADAAGSDSAARAIMTTDTVKKEFAVECEIGGVPVRIGGISKGSGMIHPNMGTMLCFLTSDASVDPDVLHEMLLSVANKTFNRISVDGDTSTNDTCLVMANGMSGAPRITGKGEDYDTFCTALGAICEKLAIVMAKDGEGAKHLITCTVEGAADEASAETIAKCVISSTLTKAAIFGADANWGRVLCAMGYSGETFDTGKVDISFSSSKGTIQVCGNGCGLPFDEEKAKEILLEDEVVIGITMGEGDGECTCWGCDITYDYIKINGDYRT